MTRFAITLFLLFLCLPAFAQDSTETFTIGGDAFAAGSEVLHQATGTDDLFMAGETLRAVADVSGNVHAAGRRVMLEAAVGGDVYAAGMDVALGGDTAGDATMAGYDVTLGGSLGGDLRASGAKLSVLGPVSGYALLAGDDVRIDAAVTGDVELSAGSVAFGEAARIGGRLVLYEETPGQIEVPAFVIPENRIERRDAKAFDMQKMPNAGWFDWRGMILRFIGGVVIVAALAALLAAVAPTRLSAMRHRVLEGPFRTFWFGFLALSAVIGSAILLAMTIVGIFVAPASIALALLGGFLGYVVGAYAFGVGLLLAIGRNEPDTLGERAMAAGIGALLAGLIGLIPILGWIFVLALTLAGVGALTLHLFRPAFFTPG